MKLKILNKNIIIGIGIVSISFINTGCNKQLDINQSPNNPSLSQGNPSLVLPVAVLATAGKVGGDLAIVGGMWSQYFTQSASSNQYKDVDTYNLTTFSGDVNNTYDVLFSSGLKNYQYVLNNAQAAGDWNYFLMATVMKAYTTEVLVDLYDQIPYSQALQGANNLTPKFDDGYSIYTSLLSSIDTALSKNFAASTNTSPGTQDLVFGGSMANWKQFAYTLKLKMYLRMINAHNDVATAGIKALYASGVTFLTSDAAVTNFTNAPGLDNPFYEQNIRQLNTTTNIRASRTFVSWLTANSDPRATSFFGAANPVFINQGDYAGSDPTYTTSAVFVQSPTDPVEFISLAESYFLQAEADYRFNGGTKTQALYNQGVMAAFSSVKQDGTKFIAAGGAYAWGAEVEGGQTLGAIEQIIRQKWASFAYGSHEIEAFFDKNRTGFPRSSPVYSTSSSYVPGQLVVTKNSVLLPGQMPKRFVFPFDETSRNPNAPAQVSSTTKVWWGL